MRAALAAALTMLGAAAACSSFTGNSPAEPTTDGGASDSAGLGDDAESGERAEGGTSDGDAGDAGTRELAPRLVRTMHFSKAGNPTYSIDIPAPAPGNLLLFAVATSVNAASAAPATNQQAWTAVGASTANVGVNVWERLADGSELHINGSVPDNESFFALYTEWAGAALAQTPQKHDDGSVNDTTGLPKEKVATVPAFVVAFIGVSSEINPVPSPDAPFTAITDGTPLHQDGLTFFGASVLETTIGSDAPHWTFSGAPVANGYDWDGVIFTLGAK